MKKPTNREITLPGEYFHSPQIYDRETREIFQKQWLCVGRASEILHSGDFMTRELDGESVILVRNQDGQINCFHNLCRHRGTRLEEEACGELGERIQCPYHAWSYDLSGKLRSSPGMSDVTGFNQSDYSLFQVPIAIWRGFIFINFDSEAIPFERYCDPFQSRFDSWELEGLVVAHQIIYDLATNWKIVFHNYSECYHCAMVHPQLSPMTSVETCSNDFVNGPLLGGPMVLSDDCHTLAMDGEICGDGFAQLSPVDRRRVYFYTLFPNLFLSPHPDYFLTHRIERLAMGETRVTCQWLLPAAAMERSDLDLSRAIEFWDLTNRQDWQLCELTYRGVCSNAYQPGPYSSFESVLPAFDEHYLERLENGP
ncbi:MAG: aromatic ring-hydroxylating dioxygenase subunit alpha [Planctomycetaceae bacterium]|nr:aromatic ring-hydroxylating dioxygenase subunit alpha [Planctomycetaceae bacterium]